MSRELAAASGGLAAVLVAALMNAVAAVMALAVLKPLRAAHYRAVDRLRSPGLQHP